jgi:chromosome segregation ATPase
LDRLSKDRTEVERQLKDGMLARSSTIDALRNELLERERAIASLRQELGHKQGETQRFVDHLAQQQEQILDLKEQLARVVTEHDARRGVEDRLWNVQEELVSLRARSEADRHGDEIRLKAQAVELRAQQEAYRSQSMDLGAAEQELVLLRAQVAASAEARRQADDTIAALGKGAEAQQERIDLWKARCTELESALDEQGSREALRTQEDEARIRTLASQLEAAELSAKSEAAAFKERIRVAEVRTGEAEAATHAAAARALGLEARIRSADARLAAIEGEQAETNAIAAQQRLLAEAHAQKAEARAQELEAKLAETESARARLEDELEERGAKNAHAERQNRELTRVVETMRSELQGTREEAVSLRKQVGVATSRAEDSARVVQERELWICLLLEEVRQRRVLPREFAPHEVEFLNRHGKTTKS